MQIMDESIMSLFQAGTITAKEAYLNANNKAPFKPLMDKENHTRKP